MHETLDERRQVVIDLLDFIHDFNKLDTTLLVQRVMDDQKFLEAAEAVLLTAIGPWKSVDALRDFCVQNLTGEKPPLEGLADRIRPRERVTPFSVPLQLLRAVFPNPGQFDVHRLRSLSVSDAFTVKGLAGEHTQWQIGPHKDECWLVTTLWARMIPKSTRANIMVADLSSSRLLHQGKLEALLVEAMPCFWLRPPAYSLQIDITHQHPTWPSELMLVAEGWRYQIG